MIVLMLFHFYHLGTYNQLGTEDLQFVRHDLLSCGRDFYQTRMQQVWQYNLHIVSLPISLGGQKIHSKVMAPNKGIFVGADFEKIVEFAPLLRK